MQNQSVPGQDSILEMVTQLSAKVESLQKELKETRKDTKKTRKRVKAIYQAIVKPQAEADTE
jgi:chaperonin cofactor prefoldin